MGRRTWLIAVAGVASLALAPSVAPAATIYVDDSSPDPFGCFLWSDFATHTQIKTAVETAQPGDTIAVCPGTYEGDIISYEDRLRIVSTRALTPTSARTAGGSGEATIVADNWGIIMEGDGVSIQGFTVRGPGNGTGVALGGPVSEVVNTFVDGFTAGIILGESGSARGNAVTGRPTSLVGLAATGDDARVLGNTVRGNGGYGIVVNADVSGAVVSGNVATGNAGSESSATGASDPADCKDFSKGTGTAGTANSWSSNTGATSKPAGLCTPPCRSLGGALTPLQPIVSPLSPVIRPICR